MKQYFLLTVFLLAGTLILSRPAFAQPGDDDGPGRKKLEQLRKIKLLEAMDLSEEQSIKLFTRERDFRKKERALIEKRRQIIDRLRELGKNNTADGEKLKEMTALRDLGIDMVNQRYDFVMGLKDFLSTNQMSRYIVFEDAFMTEVRNMLKNLPRRGAGRERQ
jgi:hypothetical protein